MGKGYFLTPKENTPQAKWATLLYWLAFGQFDINLDITGEKS